MPAVANLYVSVWPGCKVLSTFRVVAGSPTKWMLTVWALCPSFMYMACPPGARSKLPSLKELSTIETIFMPDAPVWDGPCESGAPGDEQPARRTRETMGNRYRMATTTAKSTPDVEPLPV